MRLNVKTGGQRNHIFKVNETTENKKNVKQIVYKLND